MTSAPAAPDRYDLLVMGRLGVDLYPLELRTTLEAAQTFSKSLGGSAANVAVAAARHGLRTALVSATGDDPFGRYLRAELRRLGVDDRYVGRRSEYQTPLTFCEIFPPDRFPLQFYREPIAPDLTITGDDLDDVAIVRARILWLTATGLSREPSRTAHHRALDYRQMDPLAEQSRREVRHTVLDLDYRAGFWPSPGHAARELAEVLPRVTAVVGNLEECAVAVGEDSPEAAADALLSRGPGLAVVKLGADGVLAVTAEQRLRIPAYRLPVVNGLGAGDGFGGALCRGLLAGWPLEQALDFAAAAGAIVASRRECSTAMPTGEEVAGLCARRAPDSDPQAPSDP
ncbi:5-dehydro-2-deoxygluconokinase [Gordonia sp. VNK21]|uniref:5-dehydro-2-deoxygluconokinase n=1 Tax=Gordonia sp. VNK21 TaxID=3382483 RepID=UPI0038D46D6A